jgi:DNA-binding NarL/FixJ family response regulator
MSKITILLADNSYLIRQGIRSLVDEVSEFSLIGEADTATVLSEKLLSEQPRVLILDYTSESFCMDDIAVIREQHPTVNMLAITNPGDRSAFSRAMQSGLISHLLKDCGKEEIIEAIHSTAEGKQFLCGKIVECMLNQNTDRPLTKSEASCEGLKVSVREIEIIRLIADGFSNKQIAEKLFLSVHTVTTHRKNIMNKLGVNNTAALMMFAVRENLLPVY